MAIQQKKTFYTRKKSFPQNSLLSYIEDKYCCNICNLYHFCKII